MPLFPRRPSRSTPVNLPEPTFATPYGYDVNLHMEVVPRPGPTPPSTVVARWSIGPITAKTSQPVPGPPGRKPTPAERHIIVQLTADQQVELSISGEDAYDNPVDVSGDLVWTSSDESIVAVEGDGQTAVAVAVGPVGTAAVTVSNDTNQDGTGDFQGSLAIDVVAGNIAEIVIKAGEATEKREVNPL